MHSSNGGNKNSYGRQEMGMDLDEMGYENIN
jgi:hypothetical protein